MRPGRARTRTYGSNVYDGRAELHGAGFASFVDCAPFAERASELHPEKQ